MRKPSAAALGTPFVPLRRLTDTQTSKYLGINTRSALHLCKNAKIRPLFNSLPKSVFSRKPTRIPPFCRKPTRIPPFFETLPDIDPFHQTCLDIGPCVRPLPEISPFQHTCCDIGPLYETVAKSAPFRRAVH